MKKSECESESEPEPARTERYVRAGAIANYRTSESEIIKLWEINNIFTWKLVIIISFS